MLQLLSSVLSLLLATGYQEVNFYQIITARYPVPWLQNALL
jgi:hypothetical protein